MFWNWVYFRIVGVFIMGDVENKIDAYFLMRDEKPNIDSFLRMAHELHVLNFDDDKFQRVMILNPAQMSSFLTSIAHSSVSLPLHRNFHKWQFAGFMLRTLRGKIE